MPHWIFLSYAEFDSVLPKRVDKEAVHTGLSHKLHKAHTRHTQSAQGEAARHVVKKCTTRGRV
eukprot:1156572-Pelagomonas_calceolata.AAC.6